MNEAIIQIKLSDLDKLRSENESLKNDNKALRQANRANKNSKPNESTAEPKGVYKSALLRTERFRNSDTVKLFIKTCKDLAITEPKFAMQRFMELNDLGCTSRTNKGTKVALTKVSAYQLYKRIERAGMFNQ
ncbi:MAG: hypothetical protein RSA92_04000 [Bacteroidaceae bacterium]